MQICDATKFLRIAAAPVILTIIGVPAFVSARAQAKPSTAPAAPPVRLQTYTAPDKSVSAGMPAGWKVTSADSGMIAMSGPQGESITVGQIIVAHDGPFQAGQKGPDGAAMTMPSSAKLSDKLVMIFQQTAAINGKPAPQIKFVYGALLQVPAAMGQCGVFVVSNGSGNANLGDAMGILCSLPDDSAQFFKSILMIGSAPAALAAKTAPTVLAVFKSYTIAPGWTQKMLAPFMSPAVGAQGPGMGPGGQDVIDSYTYELWKNQQVIDHGATCTDAGIIGPSNWRTAAECGYLSPDF
jgi:hypothetical protein